MASPSPAAISANADAGYHDDLERSVRATREQRPVWGYEGDQSGYSQYPGQSSDDRGFEGHLGNRPPSWDHRSEAGEGRRPDKAPMGGGHQSGYEMGAWPDVERNRIPRGVLPPADNGENPTASFPTGKALGALTVVAITATLFAYVGAVVVPAVMADNSPPYVDLKHEAIQSEVLPGSKFCYYPTAENRRDCKSVSGQHIFENDRVEYREPWSGTAKPGPMAKGRPWCATAPAALGTYQYFWTGKFVGCKGASTPLDFISPTLPVTVVVPKVAWPYPTVEKQ